MLPINDNSIRAAIGISTFKLSRIFAEGWNAARELSTEATDELTLRAMTALNPYGNEPERSRWVEWVYQGTGRLKYSIRSHSSELLDERQAYETAGSFW